MSANYARWVRQQLKTLDDGHAEPDSDYYDGIADVIAEARRRAAEAGLPDAVKACRRLKVSTAREILAACLAATVGTKEPAKSDAPLTVRQAAQALGVSERTTRDLIARGELGHHRAGNGRGQIRILPRDLDDYRNRERPKFRHV